MSKKGFQDFRLKDLTGGINTTDYPSEIEDKQCLSLTNYNFEGNKLVNDKGVELIEEATGDIQSLTIDGTDIWHISNSNLYKNNVEQTKYGGVFIELKTLSDYWLQFNSYITHYITINGVKYAPTGSTNQFIIDNLNALLTADGYKCKTYSGGIFVSKEGEDVIATGYKTYIAKTDVFTKTDTSPYIFRYTININGKSFAERHHVGSTSDTEGTRIYRVFQNLDNKISTYFNTYNEEIYLKKSVVGANSIYNLSDSANYDVLGIILNGVETISFSYVGQNKYYLMETSSGDAFDSAVLTINGETITAGRGTSSSIFTNLRNQLIRLGYQSELYGCPSGYITANNSGYYLLVGSKDGSDFSSFNFDIFIGTTDYSYTGTTNYRGYGLINTDNPEVLTQEVVQSAENNGLCDITIGNDGVLVVDKDNGGATYFTDGLMIPIREDIIGKPSVGTIYNGKTILGGYADNDNIIFSQTASPTEPLNLINFSEYSAGGQSISGGNKSTVTGFSIGENGLYVFKENSIWYSNAEKDDSASKSFNFIFNKITSNGALSQNVITDVQQDIIYLDWVDKAVRRLGYEQNLTTLRDSSISREIEQILKSLPDEQGLATASYKYPNYILSLSDHTAGTIEYDSGKTYYLNNKHFIYNVYNKSWTIKTGIDGLLLSDKGYFSSDLNKIFKYDIGNTEEEGVFLSKEYVFIDDVDYKRIGELELIGDIEGIGGDKTLEIEVLVDGENVEIGESTSPYKRIITAEDGDTIRIREQIELYDDGKIFQFKLTHKGKGKIQISDVNIKIKPLKISEYYY